MLSHSSPLDILPSADTQLARCWKLLYKWRNDSREQAVLFWIKLVVLITVKRFSSSVCEWVGRAVWFLALGLLFCSLLFVLGFFLMQRVINYQAVNGPKRERSRDEN